MYISLRNQMKLRMQQQLIILDLNLFEYLPKMKISVKKIYTTWCVKLSSNKDINMVDKDPLLFIPAD